MKQRGTGFTNVSRILQANQGSRLGQTISSGVQGQTETVRQGLQTSQSKFQEEEDKKKKELEEAREQQTQVIGRLGGQQPSTTQSGTAPVQQESGRPAPTVGTAQTGTMDRSTEGSPTPTQQAPATQQSGTAAPSQPVQKSPFEGYSADDLRNIQKKRTDYGTVLSNFSGQDFEADIGRRRKNIANLENSVRSLNDALNREAPGQTWSNSRPSQMYRERGLLMAQIAKERSALLDPLQKLQMQREYQSFLDRYNDDAAITSRLQELEREATNRGSAESFIPEEELQQLSKLSNLQYTGPEGLDVTPEMMSQTQQAQRLAGLTRSSGGREELLRRFVGGGDYTSGQKRLDQTILSQEGGTPLRGISGQINRLSQDLTRSQDVAAARAEQLKAETRGQSERFRDDLSKTRTRLVGDLQSKLTSIQTGGASNTPLEIQNVLTSQDQKFLTDPTLQSPEQRLTRGIEMAKQQGILNERDIAMLEGQGGLIQRARAAGIGGAELNRLVSERIQSTINPQTATLAGVASNQELARIAALDRIMGREGTDVGLPGASEVYNQGRNTFDVENFNNYIKQLEAQTFSSIANDLRTDYLGWRDGYRYNAGGFDQRLNQMLGFLQPTTSDEKAKTDISYDPKDVEKFMGRIKASSYDYKKEYQDSPLASKNREIGVMAQDLEKSKLGKEAVKDTPKGKIVDYDNLGPKMLASIANLNERLKKMEGN
jgi:hypothetical protein